MAEALTVLVGDTKTGFHTSESSDNTVSLSTLVDHQVGKNLLLLMTKMSNYFRV